jgi:hypothetical protein
VARHSEKVKRWLREGAPFWTCLFGIPFVVFEAHLSANVAIAKQCNWPTSLLWAGTVCQIAGLLPVAVALAQSSRLSRKGSVYQRIKQWGNNFVSLFKPLPAISANLNVTLEGVSMHASAGSVAVFVSGDIEKRLAELEKSRTHMLQRLETIEAGIGEVRRTAQDLMAGERAQREKQLDRLRKTFVRFAAGGIGWGYAGLLYVAVGTLLTAFADLMPVLNCH